MSLLNEDLNNKKQISDKCNIGNLAKNLGLFDNPELKAFITIQTFSTKRFSTSGSSVRGVSFDNARKKWQARYDAPEIQSSIIKSLRKRYKTKYEAEQAMLAFKSDMLHKLKDKYPDYFIKNTLQRRIESKKATPSQKENWNLIKDMSDDEVIDLLIRC